MRRGENLAADGFAGPQCAVPELLHLARGVAYDGCGRVVQLTGPDADATDAAPVVGNGELLDAHGRKRYPAVVPRFVEGVNAVASPCSAAVSSLGTTHTLDDSDAAICGSVCRY
jgi:hypothetical protein